MTYLPGQRIGSYEVVALLGKGGMAIVYRARQTSIRRDVAIKVIESRLVPDGDFVRRFEREAETVASLSHPHILKVFDFGTHDGDLYLVMELFTGGSLADRIRQKPLSFETTARLFEQIAQAIDYAHDLGIIHRDLKPQNVLLDSRENAILSDFGIAKILSDTTTLTQSGSIMGTPAYMSPEQWQGKPVDARVDIYALGVILFEMLTGRVPFQADTPYAMMHAHINERPPAARMIRADVPEAVDRVLDKALAKNPQDRYTSALVMAEALRGALSSVPPTKPMDVTFDAANPPTLNTDANRLKTPPSLPKPTEPLQRTARISRAPTVMRVIGGAAVAVLLLIGAYFGSRALIDVIRSSRLKGTVTLAPTQLVAVQVSPSASPFSTVLVANLPSPSAIPTVIPTVILTAIPTIIPTVTSTITQSPEPSLTPTLPASPTEQPNPETLAAIIIAGRATQTAQAAAFEQTANAIVNATDTAEALVNPTNTPLPTETPTKAPTEATAEPSATLGEVSITKPVVYIRQVFAPGKLDEEGIEVWNSSENDANLTGWTLSNDKGETYTFPNFQLPPYGTVRIATTSGTDTSDTLFWGKTYPVLVYYDDVFRLRSGNGEVQAVYTLGISPLPAAENGHPPRVDLATDVLAYCDRPDANARRNRKYKPDDRVVVTWSWFAKTQQQVEDHLRAASYDVRVDGQSIINWQDYESKIVKGDDGYYYVYWFVPLWHPAPGTHKIDFQVSWAEKISDGFDTYGPDTNNPDAVSTCSFSVSE